MSYQLGPLNGEQIKAVTNTVNADATAHIAFQPGWSFQAPFAAVVAPQDKPMLRVKQQARLGVAATKGHGCKSYPRRNGAKGARCQTGPSRNSDRRCVEQNTRPRFGFPWQNLPSGIAGPDLEREYDP